MINDPDAEAGGQPFFKTWDFWIQTAAFAALAYLLFGWLCMPIHIRGNDMAPEFKKGKITFCLRPRVWLTDPAPFQPVFIRIPGSKSLLLRRVIAVGGDTVGFYHGTPVVNGKPLEGPHMNTPCDWHFRPVPIRDNCVFVVSDDRTMPADEAIFGQIEKRQIVGAPLW